MHVERLQVALKSSIQTIEEPRAREALDGARSIAGDQYEAARFVDPAGPLTRTHLDGSGVDYFVRNEPSKGRVPALDVHASDRRCVTAGREPDEPFYGDRQRLKSSFAMPNWSSALPTVCAMMSSTLCGLAYIAGTGGKITAPTSASCASVRR